MITIRSLCTMLFVSCLAIAGCGGSGQSTSVSSPGPSEIPAAPTPGPAGAGVPCTQEIARVCGEGMIDGCGGEKTTVHACIAADATPGAPCTQEIAMVCPAGQKDACLQTPPSSANHICVVE